MSKIELKAAMRLTAMPRPKKEAEARVNNLAEPLYDHVFKIAVFGADNDEFIHWCGEVSTLCTKMHLVASNAEGKGNQLKESWVYTQIFLDFFRDEVPGNMLFVLRKKYPKARFQVEKFSPQVQELFAAFYSKLAAKLVDKRSVFREEFFEELRIFADSFPK